MRHYCTYFDSNYMVQGELLLDSLKRHAGPFTLHVLALDDAALEHLRSRHPDTVRTVTAGDLERFEPRLAEARSNRSRIEYYFTCSPILPLYVLDSDPDAADVTYLDADLCLFADPAPAFEELGDASVGIVEHRFPPGQEYKLVFGRYNVGWIVLRNDARARVVLRWWRDRCLEWCRDVPEDGRFADQKYLDRWPEMFEGVRVLGHPGLNAAPWNVAGAPVEMLAGRPAVGTEALIAYHFHGLRRLGPGLYATGLGAYGAGLDGALRRAVYAPYAREFEKKARALDGTGGDAGPLRSPAARGLKAVLKRLVDDRNLLLLGPWSITIRLMPLAGPLLALRRALLRILQGDQPRT